MKYYEIITWVNAQKWNHKMDQIFYNSLIGSTPSLEVSLHGLWTVGTITCY
jgi:hypothetical protein